MFKKASFFEERQSREVLKDRLLTFGVSFLDDFLLGMLPDDLVLLGAPSGAGKTEFCKSVALHNLENGKRVHMFALEAGQYEIEKRLRFKLLADRFYSDPNRPRLGKPLLFDDWEIGTFEDLLSPYEDWATRFAETAYKNLNLFYKDETFGVGELIKEASCLRGETDLIIIDHAHYFDWDDQNDNKAVKEIAKACRDLVLAYRIPILLVAHLRKKDRGSKELVAGLDEFHGSSDLTKIATKVITIAPGGPAQEGGFITYMRCPKNRRNGTVTRYLARTIFNEKKGCYDEGYKLGWANAETFGEIDDSRKPVLVGRTAARGMLGDNSAVHPRPAAFSQAKKIYEHFGGRNGDDSGHVMGSSGEDSDE